MNAKVWEDGARADETTFTAWVDESIDLVHWVTGDGALCGGSVGLSEPTEKSATCPTCALERALAEACWIERDPADNSVSWALHLGRLGKHGVIPRCMRSGRWLETTSRDRRILCKTCLRAARNLVDPRGCLYESCCSRCGREARFPLPLDWHITRAGTLRCPECPVRPVSGFWAEDGPRCGYLASSTGRPCRFRVHRDGQLCTEHENDRRWREREGLSSRMRR